MVKINLSLNIIGGGVLNKLPLERETIFYEVLPSRKNILGGKAWQLA